MSTCLNLRMYLTALGNYEKAGEKIENNDKVRQNNKCHLWILWNKSKGFYSNIKKYWEQVSAHFVS